MVTGTIADLAYTMFAQSYILAQCHSHKAVANTKPETPTMTDCLQHTPDPLTNTGDTFNTFITPPSIAKTINPLYFPNQSTGMVDSGTTSAVTLQQPAEKVVLHPTTTSLATCPRICIADMITISFFCLMSPGEHKVTLVTNFFKLSNLQFYHKNKPVPKQSSTMLHIAGFLTLTFNK